LPLELTPPARLRLDDLDAIADAAVAGFGLVWLPDWLVPDRVRSGRLVQLLPEVSPLVTDIYAVWPDAPHLPSRVRAAIDILAAEMPLALSDSA
jgi:DNA-binding transcriptional LysR family regulator